MPTKTREPNRVSVKGATWTKSMSISAQKFQQASKAILAVLAAEPIKFTELVHRVSERLSALEGSLSWYTISVARELEVQGKVVRSAKPVRYSKARRSTSSAPHSKPKASRRAGKATGAA